MARGIVSSTQPVFSPAEFEKAQRDLRLDDVALAHLLGFGYPQHVRRLKLDRGDPHAKAITAQTTRLMQAYLDGYRPVDWPLQDRTSAARLAQPAPSLEDFDALVARVEALEQRS